MVDEAGRPTRDPRVIEPGATMTYVKPPYIDEDTGQLVEGEIAVRHADADGYVKPRNDTEALILDSQPDVRLATDGQMGKARATREAAKAAEKRRDREAAERAAARGPDKPLPSGPQPAETVPPRTPPGAPEPAQEV